MSLKKNLDIIVYEQLREIIIRGDWKPGQFIAVDELSTKYGVSRTPILQALRRMDANKMISTTKTGHFLVPSFTEKQLRDLIEMRLLLELQAIHDISLSHISPPISELRKVVDSCTTYCLSGDIVQARKADLLFHRKLVESVSNPYLTDLYLRIQGQFMVANYLIASHTPEQENIAAEDHLKILNALENQDFSLASHIMEEHIFGALTKILSKMNSL